MFEELDTEINSLLSDIATEQAEYLISSSNTRYKQYLRTSESDFDYSVTEYYSNHTELGYQVLFYKTSDDVKYIKSVGYGTEELTRTYDWRQLIEDDEV